MAYLYGIYARALQEYLEVLAEGEELPSRRRRNLLLSYAELRYKVHGGSHCEVCSTPVRHVVPVFVERRNGLRVSYSCLCTRCLEAEKAVAKKVLLKIGDAMVEHSGSERDYKVDSSPHPNLRPMRKVRRAAAG